MTDDINRVLEYLSDWKNTHEICEEFSLSKTQWQNLRRWLMKGKFITMTKISGLDRHHTNHVVLYKSI